MLFEETAWAMAPPPNQQGSDGGPEQLNLFWILIPLFLIFWMLVIMPQKRQQKQHQQRINALKKGDRVVTNGGIYGTVVKTEENSVILAVGEIGGTPSMKKKGASSDTSVQMRFARTAIGSILADPSQDKDSSS